MTNTPASPILCGIDFSTESRRALRTAEALATQLACPLRVVSAVEPLLTEAARLRQQLPEFLAHIERDLREFVQPLSLPADHVTFSAPAGEPAAVLLAAAHDVQARVIVVGTRGWGQAARLFLGSTTLRLLRHADRPVLVTDADDRADAPDIPAGRTVSQIVCGVDFSDGALAAVTVAARLATDLGAALTLAHAVPHTSVPVGWDELARGAEQDRVAEATAHLNEVVAARGLTATVFAGVGSPADVLRTATGADPRAIVAVGLQGHTHHRPGSTALRILAATKVPVLAVPNL
jgi:nucleotide-binding universal stress UspA family protein